MPTSVLVTEAVVGKGRERLRFAVRRVRFAGSEFSARQPVSFSEIEPILPLCIAPEGDAIWIAQIRHVRNYPREFAGRRIPTVKYVNSASVIISQVEHVCDEK